MSDKLKMDSKFNNNNDIMIEHGEVIEYEMSDSISLFYDKIHKNYYIWGIDNSTFDEFIIDIYDDFNGIELDGVFINKEEFEDFKRLIKNVA